MKGLIWDGIDCYRGRMLGWRSKSIEDPELPSIHLRPMGSSDKGDYDRTPVGSAKAIGFFGAAPSFVFASAILPPQATGRRWSAASRRSTAMPELGSKRAPSL